jgi:chromate transport protein ChrA
VRYTYRYRSFFLPAVLILVGILALLVNTGQVPVDRLLQLLDLWPLILILIGADLVIRRTVHGTAGEVATAVILILAIVFAAAYVTVAPTRPRLRRWIPRTMWAASPRRPSRSTPAGRR